MSIRSKHLISVLAADATSSNGIFRYTSTSWMILSVSKPSEAWFTNSHPLQMCNTGTSWVRTYQHSTSRHFLNFKQKELFKINCISFYSVLFPVFNDLHWENCISYTRADQVRTVTITSSKTEHLLTSAEVRHTGPDTTNCATRVSGKSWSKFTKGSL